jgi:hypothetical protein
MRRDKTQLLLASFLMLFVELVLIRWAGAYVLYLSYFSNFVLLGSFLGIGIGFLRASKRPDLFQWSPMLLAYFLALAMAFPVQIDRSGSDLIYFGSLRTEGLPAWVALPVIFVLVAAVMASIAHGVADRFAKFAPLEAYRLDIAGSIAGVAAYAALSLLSVPPLGWALVIAGLYLVLLTTPGFSQLASLVVLIGVLAVGTYQADTIWSPYYRIEFENGNRIAANGIPHQAMSPVAGTPYLIPYARMTKAPNDVLIIGAGNGNDVAAALASGATSVDAVEIDPEIQRIGVENHPDDPYGQEAVNRIVNDGRAHLERSDKTYDLIVFALPDSLTLVSGQSAVRLESYLFTKEAIEASRDHLNPNGAFAMYNFYREAWLLDRLAGTLHGVFGSRPCLDQFSETATIGTASMMVVGMDNEAVACATTWAPTGEVISPATDDHPFVYLKERAIPSQYLWAMALVLAASLIFVRGAGGRLQAMSGYMDLFFMGAAFLLLETKSIVQFALLYGTTWFVNALVFGGILATVYLAIEVERKVRIGRPYLLFSLLFGGLLLAGIIPPNALLELGTVPRFVAATSLAFFPVFIANLIFAERFRDAENSTTAFGANLLGAMFGGTIEYLSLVIGYRWLLVVAGALYALSWAFGGRKIGMPGLPSVLESESP